MIRCPDCNRKLKIKEGGMSWVCDDCEFGWDVQDLIDEGMSTFREISDLVIALHKKEKEK